MDSRFSPAEIKTIISEANRGARRLVRSLRLSPQEQEDLSQDLLLDLLARLKSYDLARGSLGPFAGRIVSRRATRLAQRILRERRAVIPIPAVELRLASECSSAGLALSSVDHERDLDVRRSLPRLDAVHAKLCRELWDGSPEPVSRSPVSPATFYRRLSSLRLELLMRGLSLSA